MDDTFENSNIAGPDPYELFSTPPNQLILSSTPNKPAPLKSTPNKQSSFTSTPNKTSCAIRKKRRQKKENLWDKCLKTNPGLAQFVDQFNQSLAEATSKPLDLEDQTGATTIIVEPPKSKQRTSRRLDTKQKSQ